MKKQILIFLACLVCRSVSSQGLLESNNSTLKESINNARTSADRYLFKTENLRDTIKTRFSSDNYISRFEKYSYVDSTSSAKRKDSISIYEQKVKSNPKKVPAIVQTVLKRLKLEDANDSIKMILRDLNAERIIFKIKEDSAKLSQASIAMQKVELNAARLSNYAWDFDKFLKDSTKEAPKFMEFFNEVITLRTEIDNKLKYDIDKHHDAIKEIEDAYDSLKVSNQNISKVAISDLLSVINKSSIEFPKIENRINSIAAEIYNDTLWFTKEQKIWDSLITKYIQQKSIKKDENKINISGLPFFNILPNAKDVNGSISVFGNNLIRDTSGLYSEVGAFVGLLNVKDQKNVQNILIPESSSYGFFWKMTLGMAPTYNPLIKKFALNASFYYLGKSFKTDTLSKTDAISSSQFHGKFGFEYLLAKNALSLYANANAFSIISNKPLFDKAFNENKDLKGFVDFGFRLLLNPGSQLQIGSFKLYMDLNFIINGGDIKAMSGTQDSIIPNIRVGVRTNFGYL